MSAEERLNIVLEMQRINEKQIANRERSLELSKILEKDIENEKVRLEIKKLEIENMALFNRHKQLTIHL